jgi:hypothetical protein
MNGPVGYLLPEDLHVGERYRVGALAATGRSSRETRSSGTLTASGTSMRSADEHEQ